MYDDDGGDDDDGDDDGGGGGDDDYDDDSGCGGGDDDDDDDNDDDDAQVQRVLSFIRRWPHLTPQPLDRTGRRRRQGRRPSWPGNRHRTLRTTVDLHRRNPTTAFTVWANPLYCIVLYCIVLHCIVFIHFYSDSLSTSHSEALPTTANFRQVTEPTPPQPMEACLEVTGSSPP